jgi:CRISPR/Cas system-associated protein Cas10 (large subunit of type III CRISPR-Cas system)
VSIELKQKKDLFENHIFVGYGEKKDFICTICGYEIISMGFICENRNTFTLCESCQDHYRMTKCRHDKNGEHRHIKFIKEIKEPEKTTGGKNG